MDDPWGYVLGGWGAVTAVGVLYGVWLRGRVRRLDADARSGRGTSPT